MYRALVRPVHPEKQNDSMKKIIYILFLAFSASYAQMDTVISGINPAAIKTSLLSRAVYLSTQTDMNTRFSGSDGVPLMAPQQQNLQSTPADLYNEISIYQEYDNNQATVIQSGRALYTSSRQSGLGNIVTSESSGENIHSEIIQEGDNNTISQLLEGSNFIFKLGQYGSENYIKQYESGDTPRQYEITQTGDGLGLIITNGVVTP